MRRTATLFLLGLLPLAAACSEASFTSESLDNDVGAPDDDTSVDGQIRIDVFPSQNAELTDLRGALLDYRPQTFIAEVEAFQDVDLILTPAVQLSGLIEGASLTPWPSADLPTVDAALADAEIRFGLEGTVQQPRTMADQDGRYSVPVVPSDVPYEVAVIPADPSVPVRVQRITIDGSSASESLFIDEGVPVWGTLVGPGGEPMTDLAVTALDDRGLRSAPTMTDDKGRFVLHVAQGQPYTIEAAPTGGEILPTLVTRLDVVESNGANADATFGSTASSAVTGLVRTARSDTAEAQTLADGVARVRIIAESLDGFDEGEARYEVEVPTSNGRFTAIAPRGDYRVEVIPNDPSGPSPLVLDGIRVGTSTTTVNGLDLARKVAREGQIFDESGAPLGGAEVTCTEDGFAERTFSTIADPNGLFLMLVPLAPMQCTVTPPQGVSLAATRQDIPVDDALDADAVWTLVAREGSTIRGTLTARRSTNLNDDGSALPPVPMGTAVVQVRAGGQLLGTAISDADGQFSVRIDR